MGEELPIEPHEAILKCIRIANGEVVYASERIAELSEDEAVGPVITKVDRPLKHEKGAESMTERVEEVREGEPRLHIWIEARHKAMDRLVQYSAAAIKANVDERAVKLAEGMAQQLAAGMRAFAIEMGFDPSAPEVRKGLRAGLEAIDSTAVEISVEAA